MMVQARYDPRLLEHMAALRVGRERQAPSCWMVGVSLAALDGWRTDGLEREAHAIHDGVVGCSVLSRGPLWMAVSGRVVCADQSFSPVPARM